MAHLRRLRDGRIQPLLIDQQVGRSPSCTFRLTETYVSSVHAYIRWSEEAWQIRDLRSRNGTMVNGRRLGEDTPTMIQTGALLVFGDEEERWLAEDMSPPRLRVTPIDGGPGYELRNNMISIPNEESPSCTIYQFGEKWFIDDNDTVRELEPNSTFIHASVALRFECPADSTYTPLLAKAPPSLIASTLTFVVSPNEEHVSLALNCRGNRVDLGERTYYYLALTLARLRKGSPDPMSREAGWTDVDDILRKLPEYGNAVHLNVDIHRLRKRLGEAGVTDAGRIIERRRGQLRLGVGEIIVEGVRSSHAP